MTLNSNLNGCLVVSALRFHKFEVSKDSFKKRREKHGPKQKGAKMEQNDRELTKKVNNEEKDSEYENFECLLSHQPTIGAKGL